MQGAAVKQNINGEVEERNYVDGRLNGKELDNFIFIHMNILTSYMTEHFKPLIPEQFLDPYFKVL